MTFTSIHRPHRAKRVLALSVAVLAPAMFSLLFLVFVQSPARASLIHPAAAYSFGSDGTSATTFEGPWALAYDKNSNRLYVVSTATPYKIHAFTHTSPESYVPVGGKFPLEVSGSIFASDTQLAVDNTLLPSSGHLVWSRCNGAPSDNAFVFDSTGKALFTVKANQGNLGTAGACGVAVDAEGYIWVVSYYSGQLLRYPPEGGAAVASVQIGPGIFANPEKPEYAAVDLASNDVFTYFYSHGVIRLPSASGWSLEAADYFAGSGRPAVDAAAHRLYVATGSSVLAFSTLTGSLVEEFAPGAGLTVGTVAVDENTHAVYVSKYKFGEETKVEEWPAVTVPDVTTGPAVTNTELTASIGLAGGPEVVKCFVEYGFSPQKVTEQYPFEQECDQATPFTSDQPNVSATLPSVSLEQKYYYRFVAESANGTAHGENRSFTPHNVEALTTDPASDVKQISATLNASYIGNGEPTTYHFEWGTTEAYGNETAEVVEPGSSGSTALEAELSGLETDTTYHYRIVAENGVGSSVGADETFTTLQGVSEVETLPADELTTDSAVLHGSLNPNGQSTTYYFEYGKTADYGHAAPAPPGEYVGTEEPGVVPFSAEITGLEPGTTYHYRAVGALGGSPSNGPDGTFTTRQGPSIVAFSSKEVSEESAILTAQINPRGADTTYYFEYGLDARYGSVAPIPSGVLSGTETIESIEVPIGGLIGRTYHFRLIAESQWGKAETEDQTFDFNPPAGCPNHTVRQQTGAGYLPDCRAYELVSARRAGGAALFAFGPSQPSASNPARFAYLGLLNAIPGSGDPINGNFQGDLYVASRSLDGWTTKYVGIPGYRSIAMSGPPGGEYAREAASAIPTDLGMNRFLIWDRRQDQGFTTGGTLKGTYVPYIYDNEGHELGRLPTNVDEVPGALTDVSEGGFVGDSAASADFSHYVFSSPDLVFAEGGLLGAPGSVYDNDVSRNSVVVASKLDNGNPIPQDPGVGSTNEYIRIPAVSSDGSHILMSTEAPGGTRHLYMRVDGAVTYEVSLGDDLENHGVTYEGMTEDGSTVFFTSDEQLTENDTDSSVDLFRWDETTDSVTKVSVGSGGTGDTDACSAVWIEGCGVEVVPTARASILGNEPPVDNAIASQSGDIYFYSPEQLDGDRGVPGSLNLYVARGDAVLHVATLDPNYPAERIEVSPDGESMALLSGSQLSPYENQTAREMYRYRVGTRSLVCVSCRPDGHAPQGNVDASLNGRYMTDDGRTFFTSVDNLAAADTDEALDVYEYAEGKPQLISAGTSSVSESEEARTGLVSVSADGTDAFFATFDTLVPEDENGPYLKFYDARTGGGFTYVKPAAPCAAADECHGPETIPAAPLQIGSSAALGEGDNVRPRRRKKHRKARRHKKHRKHGKHSRARRARKVHKRPASSGDRRR